MKKLWQCLLVALLTTGACFHVEAAVSTVKASENTVEYLVKEDAFIRSGSNANRNYNYEDITTAHGAQYVGLGYRVINVKYNGNDEIISVMKLALPTKEEIDEKNLDTFKLELDLFKNLNFNNADQEYVFRYTTNTEWDETTLTWNNKPQEITRDADNELFHFKTTKGDEYEIKDDVQKHISRDISPLVNELVQQGKTEVTIYVTARYSANTGLMLHCKESEAENKQPKLIASNQSITMDSLKTLVEQIPDVNQADYTKESYQKLQEMLTKANGLIAEGTQDLSLIQNTYHELQNAYDALRIKRVDVNQDMEQRTYHENEEDAMPYRLFIPEGYDNSKTYPVIVFLHGAGERGNDNTAQLKNAIQTLFDSQPQMKHAIVIAPQCPSGKRWVETDWTLGNYDSSAIEEIQLKSVMNILKDIQTEFHTDENRIYVFGLSMGGFGTWNLLMNHSDVFAAGIPICGGADINKADILKNIPIWTFHGTADPTVPYSGTQQMVEAIHAAGGEKVTFTTYEGANHIIWNTAAAEEGLIEWLFQQKLSDRSDKALLNEAIDQAASLDDKLYTDSTWAILNKALNDARSLAADDTALQREIDKALDALDEAIKQLSYKAADYTAVDAAIAQVELLNPDDYVDFSAVEGAIRSVIRNKNITEQAQVDEMAKQIETAIKQLKKKPVEIVSADKTLLNQKLKEAEQYQEESYTVESWQQLVDAMKKAQATMADENATQIQVDEMLLQLETAINRLEKKPAEIVTADKTLLNQKLKEAGQYQEESYTVESWQQLVDAMKKAQATLMDENATQIQVDEMLLQLENAINRLEKKSIEIVATNKTLLNQKLKEAEQYQEESYTVESWQRLEDAMKKAQAALTDENATQAAVDEALQQLSSAIQGLSEKIIASDVIELKDSGITIRAAAGVINQMTVLRAELINVKTFNNIQIVNTLSTLKAEYEAYDITLLLNDMVVQPNGLIEITMNIPKNFNKKSLMLYHIDNGGKLISQSFTLQDDSISFATDHLSVYVLVNDTNKIITPQKPINKNPIKEVENKQPALSVNTGDETTLLPFALLIAVCGFILYIAVKKAVEES